jgi:amino acid adenylation domain-containing protein
MLADRLQRSFQSFAANHAISMGKQTITYEALNAKACRIGNAIQHAAPAFPGPVAILGSAGPETCAAICGTLFSGRAYMPLNPRFPDARNRKMLDLSGVRTIFCEMASLALLPGLLSDRKNMTIICENIPASLPQSMPQHRFLACENKQEELLPAEKPCPGDTAYLLFTSGSTGTPKGVPVSNANVTAYLDHVLSRWDFFEEDRFSQTFDLTFDLSVHDMMVCWLSGACLCIPPDPSPLKLASYIREEDLSVWFSVPSAAMLMDRMRLLKKDAFGNIRLSFFCGEALPVILAEKWFEATGGKAVINLYGPTEATIAISACEYGREQPKSKNGIACIGKIFDKQEYCLLEPGTMNAVRHQGELCLRGSQVISEYLNDEDLNAKYLLDIEGTGPGKWYRTGDLVEEDAGGDLFYLGRTDAEVKILGYRVNLHEVDAIMADACGTAEVASAAAEYKGRMLITGFVGGGSRQDEAAIIRHCRKSLPWYMIPERIIFVEELPLNDNGKIDRNKLKELLNDQK